VCPVTLDWSYDEAELRPTDRCGVADMLRRDALAVPLVGIASLALPAATAAASDVVDPGAASLEISGTSASDSAVTVVWTDTP
jgi:hypothetical protein